MTENPNKSSGQIGLIGEMAGNSQKKIVISGENEEEISNNNRPSECFVVDIDYLSLMGRAERDTPISSSSSSNSRTINHFQRSLSRKGGQSSHHQRGKATQTQKDTTAAAGGVAGGGVVVAADHHHESSNKGASLMIGTSNKQPSLIVVGVGGVVGATTGTEDISNTKPVKETPTVTAESSKWRRYNSIKQHSSSSSSSCFSNWLMDSRRILLFFATLSSMGTIILIYFTLSMTKLDGEDMVSRSRQAQ